MTTETKRQRQVASVIQRHLSSVIQQEGAFIYGAAPLVTVTKVKMTSDLGIARVYLSVYNTLEKPAIIIGIQGEVSRIRHALAQRCRNQLRRTPRLEFFLDDTVDEMYRVDTILNNISKDSEE